LRRSLKVLPVSQGGYRMTDINAGAALSLSPAVRGALRDR
jgi:hypothetical protein